MVRKITGIIFISLFLISLTACSISVDLTTLDFGSAETSKTFILTVQGPVEWSISCSESWVTINPDTDKGQGTYNINVTVVRTGLAVDDYEATLKISTTPSVPCSDVIVKMSVPDVAPVPSEVSGYVYEDGTSNAISGALVSIGDNTYSSDSNGYYSINVEPGSHTINASKDGYEDYSSSVVIPEGEGSIDHDIYMIQKEVDTTSTTASSSTTTTPSPPPPTTTTSTTTSVTNGSIAGRVTDCLGNPIENAEVSFIDLNGNWQEIEGITDGEGNYIAHSIPPGSYKVEFVEHSQNYKTQWYDGKDYVEDADMVAVIQGQTTSGIDAEMAKEFAIPTASIIIDGDKSDWNNIEPVFVDDVNDQHPDADFDGTDLYEFYLAKDDTFLYIMMTLYDGPPTTHITTQYGFQANHSFGQGASDGAHLAKAYFNEDSWFAGVHVRSIPDDGEGQDIASYPSDYVGPGANFIEWKVLLSDMGTLDAKCVWVYNHTFEYGDSAPTQPVNDVSDVCVLLLDNNAFNCTLSLDGEDDYAVVEYDDSLDIGTELTIEAWIKIDQFLSGTFEFPDTPWKLDDTTTYPIPIISQGHEYSTAGNYTLSVSPTHILFIFETINNHGDNLYLAPAQIDEGVWTHIAVVHTFGNGNAIRVYINGEQAEQGNWQHTPGGDADGNPLKYPNSGTPYYIGVYGSYERDPYYFNGLIDELRIWQVTRTQMEIQSTMNTELIGNENNLVAYWNFNVPLDTSEVDDLSSNGNTAVLQNGAHIVCSNASSSTTTTQPTTTTTSDVIVPGSWSGGNAFASISFTISGGEISSATVRFIDLSSCEPGLSIVLKGVGGTSIGSDNRFEYSGTHYTGPPTNLSIPYTFEGEFTSSSSCNITYEYTANVCNRSGDFQATPN